MITAITRNQNKPDTKEANPISMTDTTQQPLRILSIGAGAIGTYIGGSLALDGHSVVFLERPAVVEELKQNGLTLQINERIQRIPNPQAVANMADAIKNGPYDIALFALKSFDTKQVLKELLPYQGSFPPILCLQNGVDNEAVLAEALGPERVIAGSVTSAIGRRAAGDIVLERKRGMGIAATHDISHPLAKAMNAAGLNVRLYARPADMKWSKMLTNLLANASSAILDMTPAEIFANTDLFHLEVEQLREALRVMSAKHIHTVDLPGTPVVALTIAVRNMPPKISQPILARSVGSGRGGKMPSFHVDLHAGRGQNEVEYLNGAVARYGNELGIPTPINRLLSETLMLLTKGDLPLDTYARKPEKLLEAFSISR
jgi:2-dehydropantoate 2-reductase